MKICVYCFYTVPPQRADFSLSRVSVRKYCIKRSRRRLVSNMFIIYRNIRTNISKFTTVGAVHDGRFGTFSSYLGVPCFKLRFGEHVFSVFLNFLRETLSTNKVDEPTSFFRR